MVVIMKKYLVSLIFIFTLKSQEKLSIVPIQGIYNDTQIIETFIPQSLENYQKAILNAIQAVDELPQEEILRTIFELAKQAAQELFPIIQEQKLSVQEYTQTMLSFLEKKLHRSFLKFAKTKHFRAALDEYEAFTLEDFTLISGAKKNHPSVHKTAQEWYKNAVTHAKKLLGIKEPVSLFFYDDKNGKGPFCKQEYNAVFIPLSALHLPIDTQYGILIHELGHLKLNNLSQYTLLFSKTLYQEDASHYIPKQLSHFDEIRADLTAALLGIYETKALLKSLITSFLLFGNARNTLTHPPTLDRIFNVALLYYLYQLEMKESTEETLIEEVD